MNESICNHGRVGRVCVDCWADSEWKPNLFAVGRGDLLDYLNSVLAILGALHAEHRAALDNLTYVQTVSTAQVDLVRGYRNFFLGHDSPRSLESAFDAFVGAAWAAEAKHGPFSPRLNAMPDGTGGADTVAFLAIAQDACTRAEKGGGLTWRLLMEEEVAESFAETDPRKLRCELAQVGAVCAAWIAAIDKREGA
jgi:hypothetical protein